MSTADGAHLLEVRGLSVSFRSEHADIHAVNDVDLTVDRGETVAVVGESGSGKSMTALAILRLTPRGSRVHADRLALAGVELTGLDERALQDVRGRRVAMVFQDPMSSLNGVLTIGRQITETLERHRGLRGNAADTQALALLELVEIANPARILRQFPHQLSGGMRQRVMIAMALAGEPDLLIADEPTTALDVTIQAQILDLLQRVQREIGMALLLISHDLGVVAGVADRIVVMYAGRVVEEGRVIDVFDRPVHPYTVGLLRTVRQLGDDTRARLESIPGQPPALGRAAPGCAFAPRCPHAIDLCRAVGPALRATGPTRAACHVFAP